MVEVSSVTKADVAGSHSVVASVSSSVLVVTNGLVSWLINTGIVLVGFGVGAGVGACVVVGSLGGTVTKSSSDGRQTGLDSGQL